MREQGYEVGYPQSAAEAMPAERLAFIRRTYIHLAGAIVLFAGLEALLLYSISPAKIWEVLAASRYSWLVVLGLFMLGTWVAQAWATSETSTAVQYAGLGLYVGLYVLIFLPIMSIAWYLFDAPYLRAHPEAVFPPVIGTAALLTLLVAGGLTASVFISKKDYSFLAPILCVGSLIALGVIIVAILVGFSLGVLFCSAMVALMSGYILYTTSNVLHHYRTDQHVAAALALFAAVITLFYYILRLVMSFSSRD